MIELVVAGVNDQSGRSGDRHADAVRDGVTDMEKLDFKGANVDCVAGVDGFQRGVVQHPASGQLDLQQSAGQPGGVDRRVDQLHHVADGAGVVFVAVGDDNSAHLVDLVFQVSKIRDDVVDSEHIVFGEHDPRIDNQNVVAIFNGHHVLADLPKTPQGDQP